MHPASVVPQNRHYFHEYSTQALPDLTILGPDACPQRLSEPTWPTVPSLPPHRCPRRMLPHQASKITTKRLAALSSCRHAACAYQASTLLGLRTLFGTELVDIQSWRTKTRATYMLWRLKANLTPERPYFAAFGCGLGDGTHQNVYDTMRPCNPHPFAHLFVVEVVKGENLDMVRFYKKASSQTPQKRRTTLMPLRFSRSGSASDGERLRRGCHAYGPRAPRY